MFRESYKKIARCQNPEKPPRGRREIIPKDLRVLLKFREGVAVSLVEAYAEVGLDKLSLWSATGVAENQVVGLGLCVGRWNPPIHYLIVGRVQFESDALRRAL